MLVGECKDFYLKFMICLAENKNLTSACREQSKDYLGCRYTNIAKYQVSE